MSNEHIIGIRLTADNKELVGAAAGSSDAMKKVSASTGEAESEAKKLNAANKNLAASYGDLDGVVQKVAASYAVYKVAQYAKDAALLDARYETLAVSMRVVGNNAGYMASEMEGAAVGMQKTGISMVESRQQTLKLVQSHIDLANASKLARIAQDAAVIGNMNSSEAFASMIHGIQTGQTDVLRTIGLNISLEQSYSEYAATLNKSTNELTQTEKTQAMLNAVMREGENIAGTYEAAMGTAGKQLNSTTRYLDNLQLKFGEVFNEALVVGVMAFTAGIKDANGEISALSESGQLKQWGEDVTEILAFVTDSVMGVTAVFRFTGEGIAYLAASTAAIATLDQAGFDAIQKAHEANINSIQASTSMFRDALAERRAAVAADEALHQEQVNAFAVYEKQVILTGAATTAREKNAVLVAYAKALGVEYANQFQAVDGGEVDQAAANKKREIAQKNADYILAYETGLVVQKAKEAQDVADYTLEYETGLILAKAKEEQDAADYTLKYETEQILEKWKVEQEQAAKLEEDRKRASERMSQNITDSLMRGFESGKPLAQNLADTTENIFKSMVLEPAIKASVEDAINLLSGKDAALVANTAALDANTKGKTGDTGANGGMSSIEIMVVIAAFMEFFNALEIKKGERYVEGSASRDGFSGRAGIDYESKNGLTAFADMSRYGTLGTAEINKLNDAVLNMTGTFVTAGDALGIEGVRTKEFVAQIKTSGDVTAALSESIGAQLVPAIQLLSHEGETLADTAQRLTDNFRATNDFINAMGVSQGDAFGGFGLGSAAGRDELIAASGGLSAFTQSAQGFVANFLTQAQQLAPALDDVGRTFARLGIDGVATNEQFAELVKNQMELGNTGVVAELLSVADSFNTITTEAKAANDQISALLSKDNFQTLVDYQRAQAYAAQGLVTGGQDVGGLIAAAAAQASNTVAREAAGTQSFSATHQFAQPGEIEDISTTGPNAFWMMIQQGVEDLWLAIRDGVIEIWDTFKDLGIHWFEALKGTAAHWVETLKGTAAHWVETLKGTASHWVETLKGTASHWVESLKGTASHWVESLKGTTAASWVETLKGTAGHWVESLKGTASHWVESLKGTATSWVESLKGTATSWVESLRNTGSEWATAIYNKIKGLFGGGGGGGGGAAGTGIIGEAWAASPLNPQNIKWPSDPHLKENVTQVGVTKHGLGQYDFSYINDPTHARYRGVMSDEVRRVMPAAVSVGRDGYDRVNYGMLGIQMQKLNSFAVGSNYLPRDMIAQVHEGERIIPKADNMELMNRLKSSPAANDALLVEVRALREDSAKLRAEVERLRKSAEQTAASTKSTSDLLDNISAGGGPLLVQMAA